MKTTIASTLVLVSLTLCLNAAQVPIPNFDRFVENAMEWCDIPGCAITIVQGDDTVLVKGYGLRELGKPEKVDERTLFAIASMTKSFTAAGAATFVQDKKFAWDTPVQEYFDKLKFSDPYVTSHVTMRDLLTHRTGLSGIDCADWFYATLSPENFWTRIADFNFVHGFRASWEYQNELYTATGKIMAHIAGKPWGTIIQERLFDPLGMKDSLPLAKDFDTLPNHATSHLKQGDRMVPGPMWEYVNSMAPAAGIISNATDMVPWLKMHVNRGKLNEKVILTEEQLWETFEPHALVNTIGFFGTNGNPRRNILFPHAPLIGYGLGWFIHEYRGVLVMQDPGLIEGMNSVAAILPGKKLGIVILANTGVTGLPFRYAILYSLIDAYLGYPPVDHISEFTNIEDATMKVIMKVTAEMDAARQTNTSPSLPLAAFEGIYESASYGTITLKLEDDKFVVIDSQGNRWGPLVHWQDNTFHLHEQNPRAMRTLGTFKVTTDNQVEALVFPEGAYKRKG